jgi:HEAT repeat protein
MRRSVLVLAILIGGCEEKDLVGLLQDSDAAQRRKGAAALGASYPEGAAGIALLVDLLDDSDASVREAAAEALAALGREGVVDHARFLRDKTDPARGLLNEKGKIYIALGAALTPGDLSEPMAAGMPPAMRKAGVAGAVVDPLSGTGIETMLDIVTGALNDPDAGVRSMAAASLAVLGWSAVADEHPAEAKHVARKVPPFESEPDWATCVDAYVICLLRPRDTWPEPLRFYPLTPVQPAKSPMKLEDAVAKLTALEKSGPAREEDVRRFGDYWHVLWALRGMGAAAKPAADQLERLLDRKPARTRVEIALTLWQIAPDRAEPIARAMAEVLTSDKQASNRARALALLARMGTAAKPAAPALIQVLGWSEADDGGDKDLAGQCARAGSKFWFARRAKRQAATLLGHLGVADAKASLQALRNHKDARLRYRTANALRRLG